MPTITEKSTAWLTITFKNRKGNIQAPDSFRYRIDTTTGHSVRDWVTINNPSGSHEIKLTPDDNSIVGVRNVEAQENVVTINANFGIDDQRNEAYTYIIKNLDYII